MMWNVSNLSRKLSVHLPSRQAAPAGWRFEDGVALLRRHLFSEPVKEYHPVPRLRCCAHRRSVWPRSIPMIHTKQWEVLLIPGHFIIYICIYTFANRCGTNLLYVTQSYHTSGSPRNDPYPFFEPHPQVCPLYNYLYACIPHYCSFIHPFIHSVIHSFSHSVIHSSIHPSIHSFIHSVSHSFIHPSIHPSIHSFILSFIHSFIHSSSSSTTSIPRPDPREKSVVGMWHAEAGWGPRICWQIPKIVR